MLTLPGTPQYQQGVGPKPEPLMNTAPPTGADGGSKLVITGLRTVITEPDVPGLCMELTVTSTGYVPTGAEAGTTATICVGVQLVMVVASALLKVTVPWDPKFAPVIVTDVPRPATAGETLVTNGVVPPEIDTVSKVPVCKQSQALLATKPTLEIPRRMRPAALLQAWLMATPAHSRAL